jgi:MFS family permease
VGLFLSAFFWSYALLQVPAGLLLDRHGPTRIGRWGACLWGIASTLTAFAGGFGGVFAARMLLGIAEAPGFPVSAKATGYWFPRRERAFATALFDAAAKFSNVIGVPLVAYVVVNAGWRWGFGVTAALSFTYFIAFLWIYRDPSADKGLSKLEHRYIVDGGAQPEGACAAGAVGLLGHLLSHPKIWGMTIGFAAYGYTFYLFLTWLPGYLVQTMHMGILESATFAAIPWMVATITDLAVGGWLIDHLLAKGLDESRVRKSVLVGGMVLGLAVFGATQTTDPVWAITWISIALGGLAAAAPVGWSLPSLLAPRGGVGTVGGIMNFANNLMGAAAPIVTGFIVGQTNSFANAFMVAGVILVVGIVSFVFLMGRIEPVPEPDHGGSAVPA